MTCSARIAPWVVVSVLLSQTVAAADPGIAAAAVFEAKRSTVVVIDYAVRHDAGRFAANAIGVIVRPDGLVMASLDYFPEQVQDQDFIDLQVWIDDGGKPGSPRGYEGVLLGRDRQALAAFIMIKGAEGERFEAIDFARATKPALGQPVVMIGVLPKFVSHARTFTLGRVTSTFEDPRPQYGLSVELPLSGSPSSGIPIFALDGAPLGVLSTQLSEQGGDDRRERMSTLWPAENLVEALREPPDPARESKSPWMGIIGMQDTSRELAKYWKLPGPGGVLTGYVVPGSPAETAGLKPEDVILELDGRPVHTNVGSGVRNLIDMVRRRSVGDQMALEVWNGGEVREVVMTLSERPLEGSAAERFRVEGEFRFTVRELVFMDRFGRGLDMAQKGVTVSFLQAGWAADGGLKATDVITQIDNATVSNLAEFRELWRERVARKPREIVLTVIRGDTNELVLVRLECRWKP